MGETLKKEKPIKTGNGFMLIKKTHLWIGIILSFILAITFVSTTLNGISNEIKRNDSYHTKNDSMWAKQQAWNLKIKEDLKVRENIILEMSQNLQNWARNKRITDWQHYDYTLEDIRRETTKNLNN